MNHSFKEGNEIIATDKDLSETFFNIVEKATGSKPDADLHKFCDMDIHSDVSKIKDTCANHLSIIEIKKATKNETAFSFKEVEKEEILKLLKKYCLLHVMLAIYTNL